MAQPKTLRPALAGLTFIASDQLADLQRGFIGKPTVVIHENGQVSFSTVSSKSLGVMKIAVSFNPKSREVYFIGCTDANVKAYKIAPNQMYDVKKNKKSNTYNIAASRFLQSDAIFGEEKYDYKESGTQVFEATADEENNFVVMVLPAGAVAKREVKVRAPRKPKTEAGKETETATATATAGAAAGAVNETPVEEELVLSV